MNHRKQISAICWHFVILQHFQRHLKAWIILLLAFFWCSIEIIHSNDDWLHSSCIVIALANFFTLCQCKCSEICCWNRLVFFNIFNIWPSKNFLRGNIKKTAFFYRRICWYHICQICCKLYRCFSWILPIISGIMCTHKNNNIWICTYKNFSDTVTVIFKVIFFKYLLVGCMTVFRSGQQIYSMTVLI